MENDNFLIGKLTISMAIFHSYVTNYQRVDHLSLIFPMFFSHEIPFKNLKSQQISSIPLIPIPFPLLASAMTHDGCVSPGRCPWRRRQHRARAAAAAPAMDGSGSRGKATEHHRAYWIAKDG